LAEFGNRVLRRIFGPRREKRRKEGRKRRISKVALGVT
jgi:hypothetical protein